MLSLNVAWQEGLAKVIDSDSQQKNLISMQASALECISMNLIQIALKTCSSLCKFQPLNVAYSAVVHVILSFDVT